MDATKFKTVGRKGKRRILFGFVAVTANDEGREIAILAPDLATLKSAWYEWVRIPLDETLVQQIEFTEATPEG